jgi:hypothetical protein
MKIARGTRFSESREHVATSAHPDGQAPVIVPAEPTIVTDTTLSRIEKVMNLVLSARFSAASIAAVATTEHDRLQAELLGSALDEALAEQRILWFEMAPTMATGPDGLHRYRDVSRQEMSRSEMGQADVARSGVLLESEQQTGHQ